MSDTPFKINFYPHPMWKVYQVQVYLFYAERVVISTDLHCSQMF